MTAEVKEELVKMDAAGRQVPVWMVDRCTTAKELRDMMALRERAFPATKPNGKK